MASRLVRAKAVTVNDVLDGHKGLEIDCVDRVYLTLPLPTLVVGGQVVSFLTVHQRQPIPSPALLERRGLAFRRAVLSFARGQRHCGAELCGQAGQEPAGGAGREPVAGAEDRPGDAADARGRCDGAVPGGGDRGGAGSFSGCSPEPRTRSPPGRCGSPISAPNAG